MAGKKRTPEQVARDKVNQAIYRAAHREETKARNAGYYAAHKAELDAVSRRYQREHRAQFREYEAKYREGHRQQLRDSNRVHGARYVRRYPERAVIKSQRQLARKWGAPGSGVTYQEWDVVRHGSLGLCAYCNRPAKLTMDHIDPLSQGGAHEVANIVAACHPCNASKSDKPLIVWLALRQSAA